MYSQSAPFVASTACADIHIVPMFNDNYGYIFVDRDTKMTALVDPADSKPIIHYLKENNIVPDMLLCTHKHQDHSGGNERLKNEYPNIKVVSTKYEETPAVTDLAGEGDQFSLGNLHIDVLHTPCHTRGHVIYIVTGLNGNPIIFCGDTLFVGGCGRFFEGTASEMLTNMDRLSQYPDDSIVCCAHEYTEANFKFLASIDPDKCLQRYQEIQMMRKQGFFTVPSTVQHEKQYNLFMHCHDDELQKKIHTFPSPVETMAKLREMKNDFK